MSSLYSQRFQNQRNEINNVVEMEKHFEQLNHFRNFSENSHHLMTLMQL